MQANDVIENTGVINHRLDALIELTNAFDVCRLMVAQVEVNVPAKNETDLEWAKFMQNLFVADGSHSLGEFYCIAGRTMENE